MKLRKKVPGTFILRNNHVPCKSSWDVAVSRALKIIRSKSTLTKVLFMYKPNLLLVPIGNSGNRPFLREKKKEGKKKKGKEN